MTKKISVVGAGGWGTALSIVLSENNSNVNLWIREKELLDMMRKEKENKWFLPGVKMPSALKLSNDLKEIVTNSDIMFIAIPSPFLRDSVKQISRYIRKDAIVVSVAKGLEEGTYKRMSEVIEKEIPNTKIAALSGPNHSEEVGRKIPTATVIASKNNYVLSEVKKVLSTAYFKVYPHNDIIGVEICGAIKNITAIAAGVCDGIGFGDNSKASIITLGLTEMNRFGRHFGANQKTVYGLAGVGDLVATCTSAHSRNRFVGQKIAEGKSFEEIKKEMHGMIAEGIKTTKAVYDFSQKHNINMPLTTQVYKVLYESKDLKKAISDLIRLI